MPTYYLPAPTKYTHTKFSDAITMLATRLSDPGFGYWDRLEMGKRVVQALRMWQALTGFFRERAGFEIDTTSDAILDLHSILSKRFGFNVLDRELVSGVQYSLLEPATGITWNGTAQFTLEGVSKSLQRRRNQFLLDTRMVLSYSQLDVPAQPVGRIPLSDQVVDVQRLAWITITVPKSVFPVFRDDEFSALSFNPGWPQNPDVPQVYSPAITPPVTVQLVPPPLNKGKLELVTVNTGPDLNPAVGVAVSIPDDFSWAVEFGALADLLSTDGLTRDPGRAKYAESIYTLAVEAAKMNSSVLMVLVNGIPLYVDSVFELDTYMPSWETTAGPPTVAAMAGRNLLAVGPVPDQAYGVMVDYVPNMPIPAKDEDYLQIGREHLEAILDLAQHLCAFKQGGGEFQDTLPLFQNFLRIAGVQNSKLAANAFYKSLLYGAEQRQDDDVPMREDKNVAAQQTS